ncbi:Signal recognition particle subunit SRP72, partial [Cryomyces antarcticus]
IPDLSTRYIARVNHLASSTDSTNPYLSHRLFHSSPKLLNTDRTFAFQSSILHRDAHVMDLQSSKFTGVASSTSTCLSKQPSPTISADVSLISVLNAAAHAQNASGRAALKETLPLLEKRPNDVGLLLTIVQLYLLTGNHGSAITLFESFFARLEKSSTHSDQDVRFAPGLVATIVGLYKMEGRISHIRTELAKAASHWRRKSKESSAQSPSQASLLKAAGVALLDSSRAEDLEAAGSIFSDLHTRDPADRFSTAGFIAAYATTSPTKITPDDLATLTETNRLTADIDAAVLEAAGVARPAPPPSTTLPTSTKKRAADPTASTKAKRPRKSRLPKDYDASRTPDPERWLPLRDRSSYRPKGRKGKQRQQALTQGGVSEDSRPATPALGGEVVKGTGGAGKGKKKAKGKGGKW